MNGCSRRSHKSVLLMTIPVLAAAGLAAVGAFGRTASAAAADGDQASFRERCATRLSVAILGKSAGDELLASADPQSTVDTMLVSGDFYERFARYVNSEFNREAGAKDKPAEDAAYYLSKHVLKEGKPWSDLFVGPYKVDATGENGAVQVTDDAEGLGYFRSQPWLLRYAGNEEQGIKLATAYRILNNVVGVQMMATSNAPGADVSANGRQAAACASCHYSEWSALDHVASILSKKVVADGKVTFSPYTGGPKSILGGKTIGGDKELVQALVESENFSFNACSLSFKYLYGRTENRCEGPVIDRCIDAFKSQKTIQSALAVIAKDPGFCQ